MNKKFVVAGLAAFVLTASAASTTAFADPLIEANVLSKKNGDTSQREDLPRNDVREYRETRLSRNDTRSDKEVARDQKRARERLDDRQKEERDLRNDRRGD